MAEKTLIAWTDHTFNIAWGCTKISPGCKNCYADNLSARYGHHVWGPGTPRRTFSEKHWATPLTWDVESQMGVAGVRGPERHHLVFTSSMCDVFEDHPTIDRERQKLWPLIRATPHLTWQILTKRPDRIAANLPPDWGAGYHNVWLGTSIERDDYCHRAEILKAIPAVVHFISYEPALGPLPSLDTRGLEWVIVGGESGREWRAHEMDHAWAREVRDKCQTTGTAFFFKQSSAAVTERGTSLIEKDGTRWFWKQFPDQLVPPVRDTTAP